MKVLVTYYSRTGNTKKVAEALAAALRAQAEGAQVDVEEIIDTKNRKGVLGYLRSGMGSMFKLSTRLEPVKADASAYDVVAVGGPVWAFNLSCPVRTFLRDSGNIIARPAFFCTLAVIGAGRVFREMEDLCGTIPVSTLALTARGLGDEEGFRSKVKEFAEDITSAAEED